MGRISCAFCAACGQVSWGAGVQAIADAKQLGELNKAAAEAADVIVSAAPQVYSLHLSALTTLLLA